MPGGGVYYTGRFHLLCVKINHIATLREARRGNEPDPIEAAMICENSGADGITAHLSKDRRYLKDRDVFAIKDVVRGKYNLEIALSDEIIGIAKKIKPSQIIVVPENKGESTTRNGIDVRTNMPKIKDAVKSFHDQNILVSLCIEPDTEAVEFSKECEADFMEIHTGAYCNAVDKAEMDREIDRIYRAANHAVKIGLKVSAGHGLNYSNILPVLKARALEEVNIGHSIISRSIFVGLSKAVEEMLEILD